VINNSSVQLVSLIDDIIDIAKIEAKQMSINPIPVHINSLMTELHLFFETYIQNKNKEHLSLVLDDSEFLNNCIVFVDSTRLRQVITNLLNNAIKYTDKGFICFGYRQSSPDKLDFFVEDSGIGMKPEHSEIIFERFRQADNTRSRQHGGNGLGLSISRSLTQMMGGNLWVKSIEGEGSTFHFTISYLPITPENEHFFKLQTEEALSVNQGTVLVVEPEMIKFKYAEKFLVVSGFTALHAADIPQGIDYISKTTGINALIVNKTMFDATNDDEIKQIKIASAGLPMILIDNCDELIHILDTFLI
jgi:hypothetical protein